VITLAATTHSLEVKLDGAVTTNELPIVTAYVDIPATAGVPTGFSPGAGTTATNGATAVSAIAAPAAATTRQVKFVSVYNADTVNAIATLQFNDNGTKRIIAKRELLPGDTLAYIDSVGFQIS